MAKFEKELPNELIKQFEKLSDNTNTMFEKMTKSGAEVVKKNVIANLPGNLKKSNFKNNISLTKSYKTPSDGGVNTKVIIKGYFKNENGIKTPAPLVANLFEYGRSNSPFPKEPFFRKSFKRKDIEKAMLDVQKEYIDE